MNGSLRLYSVRRNALMGAAAILLLGAGCSQQPANDAAAPASDAAADAAPAPEGAHGAVLQGVITDSQGQPVEGAFVKVRDTTQRLLFMVISQEGGTFSAEQLPAGNYEVQGVGGDFESAWSAPVALAADGTAETSVSLDITRAPNLPPAWPRRANETLSTMDTLPEGEGKTILGQNCVSCHTVNRIAASRKTDNEWAGTLQTMVELIEGSNLPAIPDESVTVLYDYLVANLPPIDAPDPNSRFPRELLTGEARNYRVVQFDIPNEGSEPHDVAVDPWGIGWANQRIGGKLSRFDPVTYEYSEIGPPLYTRERARPGNLQITRDGMMWLPDPFEVRWLSYDIANEKWTDYPFPVDQIRGNVQGNSMALHPDGTIWESGPGAARRLNPMTGEWSSWDTPSWTRTGFDPGGYGNTIDGNGRFWLALENANAMARFDGETGEVVEFPIPVAESFPRRMDHDAEGNVWVGLWSAGKFAKVDQNTGAMTLIDSPVTDTGAYALDFDETNNLMWTTLHTGDLIARYNPETGEWLVLPLPQAETDVRRVEVDQNNPNRIWWSGVAHNARIGYVELVE
jgi:streptogramin lyase/mono/diheme cytochrome c family protein